MHSHSREANGTSRYINMQSLSRDATVVHSQSRSDCYPLLLNMQSHSREATVMPRASIIYFINLYFKTMFKHFI